MAECVMPCTDTVSVCASRITRRDASRPGNRAITLGRSGKDLLLPHLDAALLKKAPHPRRDLALAGAAFVGRVHAVDAHQAGERLKERGCGHASCIWFSWQYSPTNSGFAIHQCIKTPSFADK